LRARWGPDRLDDLCGLSDFLVIAAPLTAETRGAIDARRLALMKPSAYVIAVSRGSIVDDHALIRALQAGRLAGAGLDVTSEEPLQPDSPLWDMDNVAITPHNAGGGEITPRVQWEICVANLRRYLDLKPLIGVVDVRAGY
jgi:phosphoglycerate dehydrogenase-like enzyme